MKNEGIRNIIKKLGLITVATTLMLSMCACGKKEEKDVIGDTRENTLSFNSDGTVSEIACVNFSGVLYDISDIEESVKNEVNQYCDSHSKDAVKLVQFKQEEKLVRLAMDYKNLEDYNSFNGTDYRVVPASEIDTSEKLMDLSGKEVSSEDVLVADYRAFIIDGDYKVVTDGKILYYNEHVAFNTDDATATTDGKGEAVIIYQ